MNKCKLNVNNEKELACDNELWYNHKVCELQSQYLNTHILESIPHGAKFTMRFAMIKTV